MSGSFSTPSSPQLERRSKDEERDGGSRSASIFAAPCGDGEGRGEGWGGLNASRSPGAPASPTAAPAASRAHPVGRHAAAVEQHAARARDPLRHAQRRPSQRARRLRAK
eukprot:5269580-Prymnesium_polylepis.1